MFSPVNSALFSMQQRMGDLTLTKTTATLKANESQNVLAGELTLPIDDGGGYYNIDDTTKNLLKDKPESLANNTDYRRRVAASINAFLSQFTFSNQYSMILSWLKATKDESPSIADMQVQVEGEEITLTRPAPKKPVPRLIVSA